MTQPNRILVPPDGSSQSEAALEEVFLSFPLAGVCAIHVIQVTNVAGDGAKSEYELAVEAADEILEAAEETAVEYERDIDADLIEGNAAKTIVRYAEEYDIDHIVIGSGNRSSIERLGFGSVSKTIVRSAPCPATVVSGRREENATRSKKPRILVPIDGSEAALSAVEHACSVYPRSDVTVLHIREATTAGVYDSMTGYPSSDIKTEDRRQKRGIVRLFDEARSVADEYGAELTTLTLGGDVTNAILKCVEETGVDLVVVARHGRTGLKRRVLGGTTEAVIRRSRVPVTVVR